MIKLTHIFFVLALTLNATATASAQGTERSVDMGLTPSPVYGLWSNINRAVIVYAKLHSTDNDWLRKLEGMEPKKFTGKEPAHVLEQVKRFKTELIELIELNKHWSDSATETLLDGNLPNLLSSNNNRVTPSQVYLHSGQVLVNIARYILQESPTVIEISPLFEEQHITGKTPSDVYGMVDLGIRRLEEIALQNPMEEKVQ